MDYPEVLHSFWTLYGVERYHAEWLLGIVPLYRVVLGTEILLGLVQPLPGPQCEQYKQSWLKGC